MKPFEKNYSVTGTMQSGTDFTFDPNSLGHLQDLLSDIYSKPEESVLREISVNGYDAQVEAGYTGPIEVFTPTTLNPNLVIRDYGTGMSVDTLHQVYTQYGNSSKRNSNDVTGMLGIGSKSPLSLCSQFTVTSVHNGVRTVGLVSRSASGIAQLFTQDTEATDEPSGTTITIPVTSSEMSKWVHYANDVFQFWEPGSVLVNGKPARSIFEDATKISDTVYLARGGSDYAVMGSIGYPIDLDKLSLDSKFSMAYRYYYSDVDVLIFKAPIGSFEFSKNREELKYSSVTKTWFTQKYQDALKELNDFYSKRIEGCETAFDAFRASSLPQRFRNAIGKLSWNGIDIPSNGIASISHVGLKTFEDGARVVSAPVVTPEALMDGLVIAVDDNFVKPTTIQRKKIREYCKDMQGKEDAYFIGRSRFEVGSILNGCEFVDIDDINKVKLPRTPREGGGSSAPADWDRVTVSGKEKLDHVPKEYVYTNKSVDKAILKLIDDRDLVLIRANKNRWSRMLREMPGGTHIDEWIRSTDNPIVLNDEQKAYNSVSYIERGRLRRCMADYVDKVEDKELAALIQTCDLSAEDVADIEKFYVYKNLGFVSEDVPVYRGDSLVSQFISKYPLLNSMSTYTSDHAKQHLVKYVNMIYREKNFIC